MLETIAYGGWKNNVRLSNGQMDLVVTQDVGPRVIRLGFKGERNLFAELPAQMGGKGERQWMLRGGHRLWIAPENKPLTYELDNGPVKLMPCVNGLQTVQETGPLSGCQKTMTLTLDARKNCVEISHELINRGRKPLTLAPWALSVMAPGGMAVIPLPAKVPHTRNFLPNQHWVLWSYTDLGDSRWVFGDRYIFFKQDKNKGPNKIGMQFREGRVGYVLGEYLFVKTVEYRPDADYVDDGCNFETFSNEDFLELESLGPRVTLKPGRRVRHMERWYLYKGLPRIRTEADAIRYVQPLLNKCRK